MILIKEYSKNPSRNPQELFNIKHAFLHNAIEWAFAVLKKQFPIIISSTELSYYIKTRKLNIFASCILHNYLRGVNPNEALVCKINAEIANDIDNLYEIQNIRENNEKFKRGEMIRDSIAVAIQVDYYV